LSILHFVIVTQAIDPTVASAAVDTAFAAHGLVVLCAYMAAHNAALIALR
jgi:hypothetical protein